MFLVGGVEEGFEGCTGLCWSGSVYNGNLLGWRPFENFEE